MALLQRRERHQMTARGRSSRMSVVGIGGAVLCACSMHWTHGPASTSQRVDLQHCWAVGTAHSCAASIGQFFFFFSEYPARPPHMSATSAVFRAGPVCWDHRLGAVINSNELGRLAAVGSPPTAVLGESTEGYLTGDPRVG